MKIRDVMTKKVDMISADSTIKNAADIMKRDDVGDLPVQQGGKLAGMLTDRDIVLRAIAAGKDPNNTKVGEVMTRSVITCMADQDISAAIDMMEKNKIRRIVVLDSSQKAVGILSISDIAAHAGIKTGGEVLREVASPVHSR